MFYFAPKGALNLRSRRSINIARLTALRFLAMFSSYPPLFSDQVIAYSDALRS